MLLQLKSSGLQGQERDISQHIGDYYVEDEYEDDDECSCDNPVVLTETKVVTITKVVTTTVTGKAPKRTPKGGRRRHS